MLKRFQLTLSSRFMIFDRKLLARFKRIPLCLGVIALFVSGCAARAPQLAAPPGLTPKSHAHTAAMITHTVKPKETLWSIGKRYGVPYQDLMRVNGLKQASQLSVGATLLIPEPLEPSPAERPIMPSIPLYPNPRWDYIVIHHSATDTGTASMLDKVHRRRGFSNGLGYHFIIDNGTLGKRDGQIEIGHRWTKQQHGAHCNAGGMNYHGIGICLVGDFTDHSISQAQMDSLLQLVQQLQRYYGIPASRIIRHRDVRGKRTACPGNQFPWTAFRRRLGKTSKAQS